MLDVSTAAVGTRRQIVMFTGARPARAYAVQAWR